MKIPYIGTSHKIQENLPFRLFKTHELYNYRFNKVIYIVRNPKSVSISYYNYQRWKNILPPNMKFKEFYPIFLNGFPNNNPNWYNHVGSWIDTEESKDKFLLVKYEDLLENPLIQLKKMLNFIGINKSNDKLQLAIEASSFKNMSKIENNQALDKMANQHNGKFIRKGEADEFNKYFDSDMDKIMIDKWGYWINELKYQTYV